MRTSICLDKEEDSGFKLKLLQTKDELYTVMQEEPTNYARLILLQVISNDLNKPSYGGNLIFNDLYKIHGSSILYYSIKNQVCKEFFGTNHFNLPNTLKPIYVIANRSNQILHTCTNNSKIEILEKLEAAFKEVSISESSVVGGRRIQPEESSSTNTSEFVGNNGRNGVVSSAMNKPLHKNNNDVTKTLEKEYELVNGRLKTLATKTTSDFAGY